MGGWQISHVLYYNPPSPSSASEAVAAEGSWTHGVSAVTIGSSTAARIAVGQEGIYFHYQKLIN